MYADAILFKVHRGHVVTSNSLLVAIGIDPSGRREVLGFDIPGDSESKAAWMDFKVNLNSGVLPTLICLFQTLIVA